MYKACVLKIIIFVLKNALAFCKLGHINEPFGRISPSLSRDRIYTSFSL